MAQMQAARDDFRIRGMASRSPSAFENRDARRNALWQRNHGLAPLGRPHQQPEPGPRRAATSGGSGSWTHWLRNIAALVESGGWVLAPDLPGFGDSARASQGGDADAQPKPVEHGLQHLLGSTACDLVGFSFGAMVAGFVAAQFASRAARLVLVGAPGFGIGPEKAIRLNAWRHLKDPGQRDAVHRSNLAALMLLHPAPITELALRLHVANVLRDRMQLRRLSRTDVLARTLAGLRCPVHVIYGNEDALYRGRMPTLDLTLRQAPTFSTLSQIESAGHWVQFERADAFDEALQGVLSAKLQAAQAFAESTLFFDRHQLDFKRQCRVRRNGIARAAIAVSRGWRAGQCRLATDLDFLHAFGPARNHAAERKGCRRAALSKWVAWGVFSRTR